jgi:hypothetical protein
MCIMEELPDIKVKIIERVKSAAQQANIAEISHWSKAAEKIHQIIQEKEGLENRIRNFIETIWHEQANFANEPGNYNEKIKKGFSAKKEGGLVRGDWVNVLSSKGIILNGHGKSYRTQSNRSVGIAFANELDKPQLSDKWFLGLRDEPVDFAVLLCRDKEGKLHDFILPFGEMKTTWEQLSRSGGQVKFHIQRRRGEFMLLVPNANPLNIAKYYRNYQLLEDDQGI